MAYAKIGVSRSKGERGGHDAVNALEEVTGFGRALPPHYQSSTLDVRNYLPLRSREPVHNRRLNDESPIDHTGDTEAIFRPFDPARQILDGQVVEVLLMLKAGLGCLPGKEVAGAENSGVTNQLAICVQPANLPG